jgi:tetratricopeptide (TPR) repeat protein
MAENSSASHGFPQRLLPWLLAGLFLAVYLVTLNPWVGVHSLEPLARINGRDGDNLLTSPLTYLVTLPIKGLSLAKLPAAANTLAAIMGAAVIGVLARCVALLPHDRTREQRMRGQGDPGPLRIRLAWVPPVFAAGLLGLQLTFWEQATTFTGEMLDLLVFAFLVQCVLEYRVRHNERWLWLFAFVFGAGLTSNWAMFAFAPLFLVALVWLRSWSFFHAGFLMRIGLAAAVGLSLYLLTPLVFGAGNADGGFWDSLRTILITQKTYLFGLPAGRAALVAVVSLLPLGLIAIRWEGAKGTSMETMLNVTAVAVLHVAWLAGNIYFAFDPGFSPRKMVHLDPAGGGMPLLPLAFTGALASGYFAGYLLVLGSRQPEKAWDRPGPLIGALIKLGFVGALATTVAVPAGLVVKNFAVVRTANGPVLRDLADALVANLPARSAVVLADDQITYGLVNYRLAVDPSSPNHAVILTPRGAVEFYRRALARRHGDEWPELREMAERQENVQLPFILLLARAAETNRAFYLHASQSVAAENTWGSPLGPIFALHRYEGGQITPPPPPESQLSALSQWWQANDAAVARAIAAAAGGSANGRVACSVWSRAANVAGVILQRAGRFDAAASQFALALKLNPQNLAAEINAEVNGSLRRKQALTPEFAKRALGRRPYEVVAQGGPVDEPNLLADLGRTFLNSSEKLVRRAAIAFRRASELNPESVAAQLGFAEACQVAGSYDLALETVQSVTRQKLQPGENIQAAYLQSAALFMLKRNDEAEQLLKAKLKEFPDAIQLLDLLSYYYLSLPRLDEAIPLLEQWTRVRSTDITPFMRLTAVFMDRKQFDRALVMLEAVLGLTPENPVAKSQRADCYLKMGRTTEAKRDYEALARKFPEDASFQNGLALAAEKQKDPTLALKHFANFLRLSTATNTADYSNAVVRVQQLKSAQ